MTITPQNRALLSEVAEINPSLEAKLAGEENITFVPMAAVSAEEARVVTNETRQFKEVSKGYTPFQSGDVLIAKITPCFENGKIAQALLKHRYGFGSTEFHVVRPRPGRLDGRYLHHFLRQQKIRVAGERRMTGSGGQRRVPAAFISEMEIPLPPLAEQKRIGEVLDKAEELRAKRRTALAQLDTLSQSVFLEMFGDPVVNSRGWSEKTLLGEIADIVSGITKGRKLNGQKTRSVPYLAVANVQDRSLNLNGIKTIEATEDEISRYRLLANDLVLTEGGDPDKLGRGTLWNTELPECIHQNHIFRVRLTSEKITPLFANWLIGSTRGKRYFLKSAKQTTGIASINMTQLRGFPLLLPPIELQEEFADRVTALEKLKATQRASLAELDALFASLQLRAFAGDL
jgi:type I restriction enzyme S subunit